MCVFFKWPPPTLPGGPNISYPLFESKNLVCWTFFDWMEQRIFFNIFHLSIRGILEIRSRGTGLLHGGGLMSVSDKILVQVQIARYLPFPPLSEALISLSHIPHHIIHSLFFGEINKKTANKHK